MKTTTNRNLFAHLAGAAVLLAGLAVLGSCNYLGPAMYFVAGPDDIKAVYALPKDRSTVIFIDDRNGLVPKRDQRLMIAEVAQDELLNKGEFKDIIASRNALQAAAGERFGKPKTIVEIGQAVKARTVIFATVDQFTLSADGVSYSPSATLRVKVVDVTSEQRLFPPADSAREWFPLSVKIPAPADSPPTGTSEQLEALDHVARWTGSALAQMFYDHPAGTAPTRMEHSTKR